MIKIVSQIYSSFYKYLFDEKNNDIVLSSLREKIKSELTNRKLGDVVIQEIDIINIDENNNVTIKIKYNKD